MKHIIISRSPLRLPLGGGGTDLPSYYEKHGGFFISAAINKYSYVSVSRQFYDTISLKYSKIEEVKTRDDIKHNLIREALKLLDIDGGIEITSLADIPSGTGLGSSGAFLVGLLNSLHLYKNQTVSKRQLAEEACKIEIDILKEHEGKQDKYVSCFSGIKAYEIDKNGFVTIHPLNNEDIISLELKQKLLLFFTGQKRKGKASDILKNQDEGCKKDNKDIIERLHLIKKIGYRTKEVLENSDFDTFGKLLHQHWEVKKQYSPLSTNDQIDTWYQLALDNGALGGKIMGSGGGGFFMFYHPGDPKEIWDFLDVMKKSGLIHMDYFFDSVGVTNITKE